MNIRKVEEEIKKKDLARNFSWINQQQLKGRLTLQGVALSPIVFETFRRAVKNTNEIYEDAWDFEYKLSISEKTISGKKVRKINIDLQAIIIHFPEINITNTRKDKHTILDLFVRIVLNIREENRLMIRDTQGARMQMSYAEYSSNYAHSHLSVNMVKPGDGTPVWGSFCTGSGHINEAISEVNADGFQEADFIKYLLYLHTLVTWESLEGTPYRQMRDIFPRFQSASGYSPNKNSSLDLYRDILADCDKNNRIPAVNFLMETGRFKVKSDEEFDKFLVSIPFTDRQKQAYLCKKDESGRYWRYGSSFEYSLPIGTYKPILWFKGQHLTFKVNDLKEEEKEENYIIHPDMKTIIKEEIEYEINRKTIRQSTIDRYTNQISDAREDTKSSEVSM